MFSNRQSKRFFADQTQLGALHKHLRAVPGPTRYDGDDAEATKHFAMVDEHQFGGWGDRMTFEEERSSNLEKHAHAVQNRQTIAAARSASLSSLAALVANPNDEPLVYVYNPLSFARAGGVEIDIGDIDFASLVDTETQETVPFQREGSTLVFVARKVPAMGYRTYRLSAATAVAMSPMPSGATWIENEHYRVTVSSANGSISNIIEKSTGDELVRAGGKANSSLRVYHKPMMAFDWTGDFGYDAETPWDPDHPGQIQVSAGPARSTLSFTTTHPDAEQREVHITLYRELKRIDIQSTIDFSRMRTVPERLDWRTAIANNRFYHADDYYLSFPFSLRAPTVELLESSGFVNPDRDRLVGSWNDFFVAGEGL
jgi:hypothetical protein